MTVTFFQKFGTSITAYSPLGSSRLTGSSLLDDATIKEIAEKYSATPAQIWLAWNLSRGVVCIPKSINKDRLKQNLESQNLSLDAEDIAKIDGLNWNKRDFDPLLWDSTVFGWYYTPYFK